MLQYWEIRVSGAFAIVLDALASNDASVALEVLMVVEVVAVVYTSDGELRVGLGRTLSFDLQNVPGEISNDTWILKHKLFAISC